MMTLDQDLFEQARAGALVEHCREWHREQHRQTIAARAKADEAAIRRR